MKFDLSEFLAKGVEQKRKYRTRLQTRLLRNKGALPDRPCRVCGAIKTEAHHLNYDNPTLVDWLCHRHHLEAHRSFAETPTELPTIATVVEASLQSIEYAGKPMVLHSATELSRFTYMI